MQKIKNLMKTLSVKHFIYSKLRGSIVNYTNNYGKQRRNKFMITILINIQQNFLKICV